MMDILGWTQSLECDNKNLKKEKAREVYLQILKINSIHILGWSQNSACMEQSPSTWLSLKEVNSYVSCFTSEDIEPDFSQVNRPLEFFLYFHSEVIGKTPWSMFIFMHILEKEVGFIRDRFQMWERESLGTLRNNRKVKSAKRVDNELKTKVIFQINFCK